MPCIARVHFGAVRSATSDELPGNQRLIRMREQWLTPAVERRGDWTKTGPARIFPQAGARHAFRIGEIQPALLMARPVAASRRWWSA